MDQWHPAPRALIDDELIRRWTKENPAPDLVIHMVLVSRIESGAPWTKGKLAKWAGITDYKSRQCIAAANAWIKAWTEPQLDTRPSFNRMGDKVNNRTHSIISNTCEADSTANQPQKTANQPLARAASNSTLTLTETNHVDASALAPDDRPPKTPKSKPKPKTENPAPDIAALWDEMEAIRLRNVAGSRRAAIGKRRDTLRRRVSEHGRAVVLHTWLWLWESQHKRAVYLRDEGYGLATFLRASNLRDYVDMSRVWDPSAEEKPFDIWNTTDDDFDENGMLIAH